MPILSDLCVTGSGALVRIVMGVETYIRGYFEWRDGCIVYNSTFFAVRGQDE